jgi:hypothetical protein
VISEIRGHRGVTGGYKNLKFRGGIIDEE